MKMLNSKWKSLVNLKMHFQDKPTRGLEFPADLNLSTESLFQVSEYGSVFRITAVNRSLISLKALCSVIESLNLMQ